MPGKTPPFYTAPIACCCSSTPETRPLGACAPSIAPDLPTLVPFFQQGGLRLLIQESVWEEAVRRLQARMAKLRSGPGLDGAVDMGARGATARDLAQRFVDEAQSQGGQVSPNRRVQSQSLATRLLFHSRGTSPGWREGGSWPLGSGV